MPMIPSFPVRSESPKQVRLHSPFSHSGGRRNLQQIHVFNKPQQENCPLALRKVLRGLPYGLHLLLQDRVALRR